VKHGVRALGVAESASPQADRSTLAGVVLRADGRTDGFGLGTCTVGGTDSTSVVGDIYERLDREDIRYVIVAGVALAWYNILDMHALQDRLQRPILSVSFEDSPGLSEAIREGVENPAPRLQTYQSLPDRVPVTLNGERRYVRCVGCSEEKAREVVHSFTPGGGRPEPIRVARLLARTVDQWRNETKG
jgi:endonuclease V-like protein UPF0215 family